VIEIISQYSKAKIARIFCLNATPSFINAFKLLSYVDSFTKNKIIYGSYNILQQIISKNQIENKYGGNAITKLKDFFPPDEVSNFYEYDIDRLEALPVQKINRPKKSKEPGSQVTGMGLLSLVNQIKEKKKFSTFC
jgi:hypothetical protein